jgi:hypothetical protein
MNVRSISQFGFALAAALCLGGCLTSSGGGAPAGGGEPASAGVNLSITSPTDASAIDTTDAAISLAGNATSGAGINKVTWTNDRGGDGIASGTNSWQISGIALEFGINEITVTAEDNTGSRARGRIAIYRESGQPGTATLFWQAPTRRTDGSVLTNLNGYNILYGRISGIYDYEISITNPGTVTYVIENLMPGDWYFAMTAYDSQGLESARSNEVVRTVL